MSNSKPIKLFSFPNVIFDKVIENMYKVDVIQMMLCSKKTKQLVESVRMHAWYNDISVRPLDTNVSIHFGTEMEKSTFKWIVTTEEIDKSDEHLQCREPIGPLVIGGKRFENNYRITAADKLFTVVREEDRLSTLKLIFEFISKVYRCSGNRLNITFDAVPNLSEFLDWICVLDSRNPIGFDTVELKGGSENDRHLLLDKMERVKCIIVTDGSTAGFRHKKMRTVNWLHSHTMPKELFLARNAGGSLMKTYVEMEPAEMIKLIKKWRSGGYDQVRHLRLAISDHLAIGFLESVLEAFPWKKYPETAEPQYYNDNNYCYDLKYGHYLERNDGWRMTMIHTFTDYFRFFVWEGPVPEYTIPRGRQVYHFAGWGFHAIVLPMQPEVFKTEEAALLDQEFKICN